jgi:hypothetical protein
MSQDVLLDIGPDGTNAKDAPVATIEAMPRQTVHTGPATKKCRE